MNSVYKYLKSDLYISIFNLHYPIILSYTLGERNLNHDQCNKTTQQNTIINKLGHLSDMLFWLIVWDTRKDWW